LIRVHPSSAAAGNAAHPERRQVEQGRAGTETERPHRPAGVAADQVHEQDRGQRPVHHQARIALHACVPVEPDRPWNRR